MAGLTGGGGEGDGRQDPGLRARPQRRNREVHAIDRRRQRGDRPGGRRLRREGCSAAPARRKGNVVEIWGGLGTQASARPPKGFHEAADKEAGIKYLLKQQSADWKQAKAYEIMSTALRNFENIDLVYGHNDPMAYGAYLAAKDAGREKEILFLGVDALPERGRASGSTTASWRRPSSTPRRARRACARP